MTATNINMLSKITYIISCPIVIHILSHILWEQLSTTFGRFLLFRLFIDSSKATGLSQRSQFNLIFSLVPRLFEHSEFSPLPRRFIPFFTLSSRFGAAFQRLHLSHNFLKWRSHSNTFFACPSPVQLSSKQSLVHLDRKWPYFNNSMPFCFVRLLFDFSLFALCSKIFLLISRNSLGVHSEFLWPFKAPKSPNMLLRISCPWILFARVSCYKIPRALSCQRIIVLSWIPPFPPFQLYTKSLNFFQVLYYIPWGLKFS